MLNFKANALTCNVCRTEGLHEGNTYIVQRMYMYMFVCLYVCMFVCLHVYVFWHAALTHYQKPAQINDLLLFGRLQGSPSFGMPMNASMNAHECLHECP